MWSARGLFPQLQQPLRLGQEEVSDALEMPPWGCGTTDLAWSSAQHRDLDTDNTNAEVTPPPHTHTEAIPGSTRLTHRNLLNRAASGGFDPPGV